MKCTQCYPRSTFSKQPFSEMTMEITLHSENRAYPKMTELEIWYPVQKPVRFSDCHKVAIIKHTSSDTQNMTRQDNDFNEENSKETFFCSTDQGCIIQIPEDAPTGSESCW